MLPRKMEKTTQISPRKAILLHHRTCRESTQYTGYHTPIPCVYMMANVRSEPQKPKSTVALTQSTVPEKYCMPTK